MPSAKTGEMGCAFVIRARGSRSICPNGAFPRRRRMARQKFPEHVVLVDDLPRVPSGKVRKDVLRERAKAIADGLS